MSESARSAPESADILKAHAAEWLSVVARRRSRRSYDPIPVDAETLRNLDDLCSRWRPYPEARVVLVDNPRVDVFTGVLGSYGKISGAPHILVFIADESADFPDQHIGYSGEAVILEATQLGMATCWVAGFFSAKKVAQTVALTASERVFAVSPLGFAPHESSASEVLLAGLAGAHHRKSVAQLAPRAANERWPQWAVAAVETARLAPSAVNRQSWRFRFEEGGLVLSKDNIIETSKVSKRFDIGIAMLHVELATLAHGVDGIWTDLSGTDVARFDPTPAPA